MSFLAALECLKDNVMILRVLRLIKIILILSNLKIRMDGIITKIEEFAFSRSEERRVGKECLA